MKAINATARQNNSMIFTKLPEMFSDQGLQKSENGMPSKIYLQHVCISSLYERK